MSFSNRHLYDLKLTLVHLTFAPVNIKPQGRGPDIPGGIDCISFLMGGEYSVYVVKDLT